MVMLAMLVTWFFFFENCIRHEVRRRRAPMAVIGPIKGKSQTVRGVENQEAGSLRADWDLKLVQKSQGSYILFSQF